MNLATFKAEEYPIVVQVIKGYLSLYQPDFDYRVMEPYRPTDVGQTEMMIMKMRRELVSKAKMLSGEDKIPSPSKSKSGDNIDPPTLSTKDVSRLMGVSHMTVVRLADDGTLPCKKTPKGHRRFKRSDVQKLISTDDSPTLLASGSGILGEASPGPSPLPLAKHLPHLPEVDQ